MTPDPSTRRLSRETVQLLAMTALFFIVQCAVGVLRPIKNAIALEGLGSTDFYKVYLVSAGVVLFVPFYARLVERVVWRQLVPVVSLFLASNLLIFRMVYQPTSSVFGMVFYGWYDLLSATLISQYFISAQHLVDARSAKRAYPILIAGGSFGAAAGGALTGFLTTQLGTRNLLLVAGFFIVAFGVGMPFLGRGGEAELEESKPKKKEPARRSRSGLRSIREVLSDPHVRLIAVMVLVTIIVKQLVDYQYNALTKDTFQTAEAVSAFQGKFTVATQLLPLIVLLALRPLLRRYGVGVAVLMLPAGMLLANLGMAVFWTLGAVVVAKATETTLRYSAERAGREILYVPVPAAIKMRAKAYIDVALEEGLGKALAAGVIFLLLQVMTQQRIALVGFVLSGVWLALGVSMRREYVKTLERSIEGRFASIRGLFSSLGDATSWPIVKRALATDDPLRIMFAMDLVDQSPPGEMLELSAEIGRLLDHPSAEVRVRALALVERFPQAADRSAVRARLSDPSPAVREAAVRAFCADASKEQAIEELLASAEAGIRSATLACIARGEVTGGVGVVRRNYVLSEWVERATDAESRAELALAAGTLEGDPTATVIVERLLDDSDPTVASTAMVAAGKLRLVSSYPKLIAALGHAGTREAARDALETMGEAAVEPLATALLDPATDPVIRRVLPSALARIPGEATITALLQAILAPETEQLLDYRTIKALSKLRARHPDLPFDTQLVLRIVRREAAVARELADAHALLGRAQSDSPVVALARGAFADAWRERREGAFRCLGLILPPEGMYRCYLALSGESRARANALEWLEQTVGYGLFHELGPILLRDIGGDPQTTRLVDALSRLTADTDAWVVACAVAAAGALDVAIERQGPEKLQMSLIETVFLLQRVDLLKDARGAHLALLATIAEDLDVEQGAVLIREGEPTEALYVVTRGQVELRGVGGRITVGEGNAFGTWALIDEAPSPVEATALEPTSVVRIRREEFHDLVADHPELAIGLLQGLARRIRTLVA